MSRTTSLTTRRQLLRAAAAAGLAAPLWALRGGPTRAAGGPARRAIFFYFPDGVAGPSQDGEASEWHCTGSEASFELSPLLAPLGALKAECLFLNGLTMGPTDAGSHPGGAKKLLTAVDGGNGTSIDQALAQTAGKDAPFRHLYLGAMAAQSGASGDKFISYPSPGQTVAPEDDPRAAFTSLFGAGGMGGMGGPIDPARQAALDAAIADVEALRADFGELERAKLDLHLESLNELKKRLVGPSGGASCDSPAIDTSGFGDGQLYDSARFPAILKAQIDLTVLAMGCGLTRVGVIQGSQHTSELVMSRFEGTEMFTPDFDMRSHQASHYGPSHDLGKAEYAAYVKQRRWWVEQFAYLLQQLKDRPDPEGGGSLLDTSIVLLCTEVCDGNTHLHDNMPFVLAGRAGGAISPGRLLTFEGRRHADLLLTVAHAMGQTWPSFGEQSAGPLPGVLG